MRAELGDAVEVVGDADEVGAAIELIAERVPDVVLLDVHMPDGGGQAVIEAIGRSHPDVRFLALSVSDAAEDVIGVIRAGARGYVTKTISGPELTDAVERVADGDAVFSPRLAGFVLDAFAADPAAAGGAVPSFDPELDQLTPREREVLRLIARGYAYKEVARSCRSRSRPSRATSRPCCASCSSRAATSSPAGRPSAACCDRARRGRSAGSGVASDHEEGADHVGADARRRTGGRSRARTGRRAGTSRARLATSCGHGRADGGGQVPADGVPDLTPGRPRPPGAG